MTNRPYEVYDHAGQIPLEAWHEAGIRIPIFDKDNTLTPFHDDAFIDPVIEGLKANGLPDLFPNVAIASNSRNSEHIRGVTSNLSKALGIHVEYVCQDMGHPGKPNPRMGLEIAWRYNVKPEEIGVIGDRYFTDVLFGKRLGAGAIALCKKVGSCDARFVPILRIVEAGIVKTDLSLGRAIRGQPSKT